MSQYPLYQSPKLSDAELLSTFPEARDIIPQKITEYEAERKELLDWMKVFSGKVHEIATLEQKDNFFIWFWSHAYLKYFYAPRIVILDKYLYRLKNQSKLLYKNNRKDNQFVMDWETRKEQASKCSLEEIALPYLERVRQVGSHITALCPFHKEKTPSFTIFTNENRFHCFGCQKSGDVVTFKMLIDDIPFAEAVRRLAL